MKYRHIRRLLASLFSLVIFAACICVSNAESWTKELASGVSLSQMVDDSGLGAGQVINVLRVDPSVSGVKVAAAIGRDTLLTSTKSKGRKSVSAIVNSTGAVAAVNADYFAWTGAPLGLLVSDGELIKGPWPGRVSFGVTADRRFLFGTVALDGRVSLSSGKFFGVAGMNRPRGKDEIVVYTSRYGNSTGTSKMGSEVVVRCDNLPICAGIPVTGTVTQVRPSAGNTRIPKDCIVISDSYAGSRFLEDNLNVGTKIKVQFNLSSSSDAGWGKVLQAVGGGPWLVKDGRVNVDARAEKFVPSFYQGIHPRTAVGCTGDGKLLIVTVDGRQKISRGMTLSTLAKFMKSQGCVQAMNFDGGGSTTMATSCGVLNSPSGGTERLIADAIAVFGIVPFMDDVRKLASAEQQRANSEHAQIASRAGYYSVRTPSSVAASAKKQNIGSDGGFIIAPLGESVRTGHPCRMALLDASTYLPLPQSLLDKAVWSTSGGIGFIDQSGLLHPMRARSGYVRAAIGKATATLAVSISSSAVKSEVNPELGEDPLDAPEDTDASPLPPMPQP